MNATMKEKDILTLRQRLERWETELRLARRRHRRRQRAEALPEKPAPVLTETAGPAKAEPAKTVPAPGPTRTDAAPARSHAFRSPRKPRTPRREEGPVVYAPVTEKSAGKEAVPAFTGNLSEWMSHIRRRLHSIGREEKARRFPESNRLPIQLLLFGRGMLPMLGSRLRERKLFHRRSRISRTASRRPVEHRRAHTLLFLGAAAVVVLVVGFFSFFTVGTVVSYDGQELGKVDSVRAARAAASDL